MLLHWGDQYLRKLIPEDLESRLHETRVDPHYHFKPDERIPHLDADTGEIVRYVQMPVLTRVSRKRLRQFLSENQDLKLMVNYGPTEHAGENSRADLDSNQFNRRLKTVDVDSTDKVTVEFDDGSRAEGACLIGCDGSRSRVRTFLCGDKAKPEDMGITMINHVATYTAEQAQFLRIHHPIVKLAFSSSGVATLLSGKPGVLAIRS